MKSVQSYVKNLHCNGQFHTENYLAILNQVEIKENLSRPVTFKETRSVFKNLSLFYIKSQNENSNRTNNRSRSIKRQVMTHHQETINSKTI